MQIQATYKGEKYELPTAGLADMVAFEQQFDVSAQVLSPEEGAEDGVRLEYLCFLVYRGLKKLKALPPGDDGKPLAFGEEFLEGIEELDIEGEDDTDDTDESGDDKPDPTVPAQVTG